MKILKCLVVCFLLLFVVNCLADDSTDNQGSFSEFKNSFTGFGLNIERVDAPNLTTINMVFDMDKVIASIPTLKTAQLLNPDLTQTEINTFPMGVVFVFAQEVTPSTLMEIYNEKGVNALKLNAYINAADDYGNIKKHLMYSLDFNKNLANKISWDTFDYSKLPKIAPNYRLGDWFGSQVANEASDSE